MHSAASSATMYLSVLMDLTTDQIREARRLDYAVAAARSIPGVHYESDNLAGLAIGQQIIGDCLPGFLESFGFQVNRVALAQKIAAQKHAWYEWKRLGCNLPSHSTQPYCDCPGCNSYTLVFRQTVPYYYGSTEWSKNPQNPFAENFAILDRLEDLRGAGGFAFKLSWPGTSHSDQVWRQTSNPVYGTENGGITGYESVSTP